MSVVKIYLVSMLLLVASDQEQVLSVADFLEKECNAGKQESCVRFARLSAGLEQQKRLEVYAENFAHNVDGNSLMLDQKKPDLAAAYPLVMHDFFQSEAEAGVQETLDENRLPLCAEHYHNHWVNKKLWWPSGEDGLPDWASIYEFIVDHYYGFCLRQK